MSSPRSSLVIVSYNSWDDLRQCLDSVLQDPQPPDEIIVVDNASEDGSPEHLRNQFPQVRLVETGQNLGFAAGCNLGARQAQGDYLAFLNPDTLVAAGWLRALVSSLENDPCAGLATGKILLLDQPDKVNTCGNNVHLSGLTLCRGLGHSSGDFNRPAEVNAASGACFAMRRELFLEVGGFDEDFFMYMEDTDLSLRLRLVGYRCLFNPEAVVYHQYRLKFGPHKTFFQERNRYLMLLKTLRWATMLALLPALLLAEVVTWGFVLLREPRRAGNKLAAYGWIIQHWQESMAKRQVVQAARRKGDRELLRQASAWLEMQQASRGAAARLAEALFNPFFLLLKPLTLLVVWW